MDLELLLAHADDHEPVLDTSLPLESLSREPQPSGARHPAPAHLYDPGGDPNLLPTQRWGIVAPEGPTGDRLLALVEPLRLARQQGQDGEPIRIYRVPSTLSAAEALRWKDRVFRDESVPEAELPRYLLFLGDLHEVSLELQQVMASDCLSGRLAFTKEDGSVNEAGFEAYVEKVLRWERAPSREARPQVLLYTAEDGSAATLLGHQHLIRPLGELCRGRQAVSDFPARGLAEIGSGNGGIHQLLKLAAEPTPSVLLTLSHGLGAPRAGWSSPRQQRALQGAMCVEGGLHLLASDVMAQPFLPGGLWFLLACFGAGTPSKSAYHHWLRRLRDAGDCSMRLEAVLASLPREGERPFIAALPQAALANPNGPLAVMGHIDLAWTYGFADRSGRSRPSRFMSILRALVNQSRAGVGLSALTRYALEVNLELTTHQDHGELARAPGESSSDVPAYLGHLWMLRQDLSGYVLLGDPAVRLPLERSGELREGHSGLAAALQSVARVGLPPAGTPPGDGPARLEFVEELVIALLTGDVSAQVLARNHGVSLSELRRWENAYRDAGRRALEEKLLVRRLVARD